MPLRQPPQDAAATAAETAALQRLPNKLQNGRRNNALEHILLCLVH
jgi:hypothetical protein